MSGNSFLKDYGFFIGGVCLLVGIACIIIAYTVELTDTWSKTFVVIGSFIIAAGILLLVKYLKKFTVGGGGVDAEGGSWFSWFKKSKPKPDPKKLKKAILKRKNLFEKYWKLKNRTLYVNKNNKWDFSDWLKYNIETDLEQINIRYSEFVQKTSNMSKDKALELQIKFIEYLELQFTNEELIKNTIDRSFTIHDEKHKKYDNLEDYFNLIEESFILGSYDSSQQIRKNIKEFESMLIYKKKINVDKVPFMNKIIYPL